MYVLFSETAVWFGFALHNNIEKNTTVIDVDTVFNNQVQETHNLIIQFNSGKIVYNIVFKLYKII